MSKKRSFVMIDDVENALQSVKIDKLATLLYKNWFVGRLTVTCPEPDDTVELAGGFALFKKDMERLQQLEGLKYKITSVNGRIRLKFELTEPNQRKTERLTSPFSLQTARELFEGRGDIRPDRVETLSDFIFLVFKSVLVEQKPKVDVVSERVTIRFLIPSVEMNQTVFSDLFLVQPCTSDISTFFVLAKKDVLELVVEFLFE